MRKTIGANDFKIWAEVGPMDVLQFTSLNFGTNPSLADLRRVFVEKDENNENGYVFPPRSFFNFGTLVGFFTTMGSFELELK